MRTFCRTQRADLILLFTLLCVITFTPTGSWADAANSTANLLFNGSFELVGDQPDQAAGWLRWGDWINREDSWTPTHEGKAVIGYHHWQIEKPEDSGMWQDVKVEAGQKYKFTIFVQRDDPASAHGADNIQLALETPEIDGAKTIKSNSTPASELPTGTKWNQLSVEGVAKSNTLRVLIRLVPSKDGPRGGAIKMDDAALTLVKP